MKTKPVENKIDAKRCSKCKEIKLLSSFPVDARKPPRRSSQCKRCRANDQIIRSKEKRQRLIELLGGRCACCAETRYEFMSIDHIHGGGWQHRRDLKGSKSLVNAVFAEGIPKDKYQILCHNCNQAKGHYGYCPHEREANA